MKETERAYVKLDDTYGVKLTLRPYIPPVKGEDVKGRVVLVLKRNDGHGIAFEMEQYHVLMLNEHLTNILNEEATTRDFHSPKQKPWEGLQFEPKYKAWAKTKTVNNWHLFLCSDDGLEWIDSGSTGREALSKAYEECPLERMPDEIFKKVAGERAWMYERID